MNAPYLTRRFIASGVLGLALSAVAASAIAAPQVQFAEATSTKPESSNIVIEVKVSEAAPNEVRVAYAVTGGSATRGDDFVLEDGELVFPPNALSRAIIATIVPDQVDELDETLVVTLSDPVNADLGTLLTHTYTIEDNDSTTVAFELDESEGHEGLTPAEIDVELSGEVDRTVSVGYAVVGGSATAGQDFVLASGRLDFPPGETSKAIELEVVNDDLDELDETVVLQLSAPSIAELGSSVGHVYTIRDNDTPVVRFSRSTATGEESASPVRIALEMSAPSDRVVTVGLTASGSASGAGVDYTLASETIAFAPGETEADLIVDITNDGLFEPDETIVLTLDAIENGVIGSVDSFTYWIVEDDILATELNLFRQALPTRDGNTLTVIGSKAQSVNVGGIAVDSSGNLYVSDQGASRGDGEGAILFLPEGRDQVLTIIDGLTQPGDIELSADESAVIVAGANGEVSALPLGLSIRLTNVDALTSGTRIHVLDGVVGEQVKRVSSDGYFHFTGLSVPGQRPAVDVVVTHGGETRVFPVALGGASGGHRLIDLEF